MSQAIIKRPVMAMAKTTKNVSKPPTITDNVCRYYLAYGQKNGNQVIYNIPIPFQQPKTLRVAENIARLATVCNLHWVIFAFTANGQRVIIKKG